MSVKILEGQKDEVARRMLKEIRDVDPHVRMFLFIDEAPPNMPLSNPADIDALLAEMDTHTVSVGEFDDSREAIYTRLENE